MQAIVYCRVSTLEQTENFSLATQEEIARSYCARHGWDVDRVFIERGESAKTAHRTQLQALLDYCAKARGRISYLVVYNLSRFARDNKDHHLIRSRLASLGVSLRSATEPIDDTPSGKLVEGIFASFAQFDNDQRSERVTTGMKAALSRGRWVFQPPLGYRSQNGTIELDAVTAPLVRFAFEAFAGGRFSLGRLVAELDRKGLRARRGGKLTVQTLVHLLRNPFYVGKLRVERWDLLTEGTQPALIAQRLFDRVQLILAGRRPIRDGYLRQNPDFPLRRFIRCGRCGHPLTGAWARGRSDRYAYYWCHASGCRAVKCRRERLEQDFVAYLDHLRPSPGVLELFRDSVRTVWQQRDQKAAEFRTALQARLRELEKRQSRLLEAFLYKEAIDDATFRAENQKMRQEKELAEVELRLTEAKALDLDGLLDFAGQLATRAGALWQAAQPDRRLQLQRCLFPEGATYLNGTFRTAVTGFVFSAMNQLETAQTDMVSPTGFEPVLSA